MSIKERIVSPMAKNFLSLVLLQGVNYLLPLLSFPFLFRVLEVERWGLVSFGYAFIQYFIIFTDFGFNLSGTKYISENRNDIEKINRFLNAAMFGRFFLSFISFLILLLIISTIPNFQVESKFYLLYFGIVIGNVMFPMWFFQGMETMKYMTIFNIISKALSIIPFFFFIRTPDDYIYVPVFYSIGFIAAGIISIYIIYRKTKMRWFIPSISEVKFTLKDSSTYFLSRASTSLFTTSNSFIIGLVLGNTAVGYYSAAEKLYQAYNQLLSPFLGVLFPHIAKSRDVSFFKSVFRRITIANVFCVTIALMLSVYILYFVYGKVDVETLSVFRTLMFACFATIPSMLLGYPFLAAMGHPNYTNWTLVIISLTHILILFILITFNMLSINTVAYVVILSEYSLLVIRLIGVKKFNLFSKHKNND